jgi:hypothetical protein
MASIWNEERQLYADMNASMNGSVLPTPVGAASAAMLSGLNDPEQKHRG